MPPPRILLLILSLLPGFLAAAPSMSPLTLSAVSSPDGKLTLSISGAIPGSGSPAPRLFVAMTAEPGPFGSAIVPYGKDHEGSTVFLPFQATYLWQIDGATASLRRWDHWRWQDAAPSQGVSQTEDGKVQLALPPEIQAGSKSLLVSIWAKNPAAHGGWGELLSANDPLASPGPGDQYLATCDRVDLSGDHPVITPQSRLGVETKPRIYQLFVRHFSNTNATRKPNGSLAENGCGKFSGINDAALDSLKAFGVTHLWLTGVLQQATGTDYSAAGAPADDPDLLKGIAGSPYAIKDYFDVCPDYADDPTKRVEEFHALLDRIHAHGLKALIDLVPNHVARSYKSDIRPDLDFGTKDDHGQFIAPDNHFFYLSGTPPLHLPTTPGPGRDQLFDGEKDFGRVTGNNAATWTPSQGDWYETVKLNYGYDFRNGKRLFPNATSPDLPIPSTWQRVDAILAYWQELGVDGFRCDMSHMVPPEFWKWAIHRARERQPGVFFMAEAYNNDPAKVPAGDPFLAGFGNVMLDLLDAGFNAVYDDPSYKTLKGIYDEGRWANDLAFPNDFLFQNSLRYAENHDEVRLASKGNWGGVGAKAGPAISTILYGVGRGPAMLYNGQETGEPAAGAEGFGGDDGRSSIFDYWSLPTLMGWVDEGKFDGGQLSDEQKALRQAYGDLLNRMGTPVFTRGHFLALNPLNNDNPAFGRLPGETASGHWLYAYLRQDPVGGGAVLVAVNLHPTETLHDVSVKTPTGPVALGDLPPLSSKFVEQPPGK